MKTTRNTNGTRAPAGTDRSAPGAGLPGRGATEGGFTLIEIAVGIVILVIGLMGLAYAMVSAYHLQQVAAEKKIALTWASSQLERIRGMPFADMAAAPPTGYLIKKTWSGASSVGVRKDLDSDGDEDYIIRYFYSDPAKAAFVPPAPDAAVPLYDANLNGLRAIGNRPVGEIHLLEPGATSGLVEDSGYWVTIVVQWNGAAGNSRVKMGSFVAK